MGNTTLFLVDLIFTIFLFRSFDHRGMVEMDRFVTNLSGQSSQVIQRRSKDNHQTMKDSGMTVNRYLKDNE